MCLARGVSLLVRKSVECAVSGAECPVSEWWCPGLRAGGCPITHPTHTHPALKHALKYLLYNLGRVGTSVRKVYMHNAHPSLPVLGKEKKK